MQLISEAWNQFWKEGEIARKLVEEGLDKNTHEKITNFDMLNFRFTLEESYPEPDCGLRDFPSFTLEFFVDDKALANNWEKERITLKVSKDFVPIVIRNGETVVFDNYFGISDRWAYRLGEAIEHFSAETLKRYLAGELQLSD